MSYRERGHSDWREARTVNLSRTGVLMESESGTALGAPIELLLKFGPPLANVSCSARVVRAEQGASSSHWRVAASIFRYAFLPGATPTTSG